MRTFRTAARLTALATIASVTFAGCTAPPRTGSNEVMRERVALAANLLDIADVAHTVFHNEVAKSIAAKEPRRILAFKEMIRNNASGNVRALALGQDPYGALVDLYVWVHLAQRACVNRLATFPELKFDCDSTYGEVRLRLEHLIARDDLIKEAERAKLDEVIADFLARHPDLINAGLFRIDDLADYSGTRMAVLDAAPEDMLSPVTDAASELEQARLIGMQMVWLASRLPNAAGWEAQTVVDMTLAGDELLRLTTGIEKVSAELEKTQASLGTTYGAVAGLSQSVQGLQSEVKNLSAAREIVRDVLVSAAIGIAVVVAVLGYLAHLLVGRIERRIGRGDAPRS